MKISEARQLYSTQIKAYHEQQIALSKQKQELEHKINTTPDGKNIYANEAATLELTIEAVNEKQDEYKENHTWICQCQMLGTKTWQVM